MADGQNSTILVVDDEPFILKLLARVLKAENYNVLVAGSGEQALTILGRNDFTISLLLTDVMMPGMDGVQLAQTILKIRPDLPVLFVSGRCDLIPLEMKCGYVPKPFTTNDLVSRVAECLNGSESQQRAATGS